MRRTVRLTERDLTRLVRRVIREQDEMDMQGNMGIPNCEFKNPSSNSGPGTGFEISGDYTKITTNGSVAPKYQGYTVHTINGPFCFIPRY